ncbi:MAG: class I SAM-dependent methyltransferase [Pseudomonadota bacterium]
MTKFDNTRWAEKDFAHEYLETADIRILERKTMLEVLKSFYRYFLGEKQQNTVLDLGCGDGILAHELLKIDGSIYATLIDGSEDMLDKARERLTGFSNTRLIKASFQDLLYKDILLQEFSLVISSLAIHHLTTNEKKSIFNYIYSHLSKGGYFLNTDVVLSPTETLEKWYLELWKEWIIKRQTELNLESGHEGVISNHKEKEHHSRLDTLTIQLNGLKEAGFKDVDCFYKYGIFAVYGGRK